MQKFLTFFQQKMVVLFAYNTSEIFNFSLTNNFVSLEQPEPDLPEHL